MSAQQLNNKTPSNIYTSNKNASSYYRDDFLLRDYQNLSKLDIETPFMNIFDAIDRLLPFHIFHFEDSEFNEDEELNYRNQINDKLKDLQSKIDELENKVSSTDASLRDHDFEHEEDRYFGERALTKNFQERYEKEKTDSALAVHATAKRLLQNKRDSINAHSSAAPFNTHSKNPLSSSTTTTTTSTNPKLWNYTGLSPLNYKQQQHSILQGKYTYHHHHHHLQQQPSSNQIYMKNNVTDNNGISEDIKKQYQDNMSIPFISPNMNSYMPSKPISNMNLTTRQNANYVDTQPISNLKQMLNHTSNMASHQQQLPQLPTQNYNTTMFPSTTSGSALTRTQMRNHGFIITQQQQSSQNSHNNNESM